MNGRNDMSPRAVSEMDLDQLRSWVIATGIDEDEIVEVMAGRSLVHYANGHWSEARAAAAVALALVEVVE